MLKEKPDSERCLAHDHLSINTSLRTSTTSTFMNEWSPTGYLARSSQSHALEAMLDLQVGKGPINPDLEEPV